MKNIVVAAGCVAVQLDAEEVSSALLGAALVQRHWLQKAAAIEKLRESGWRHMAALAFGSLEASRSLESKLASMDRYVLPFRAWDVGVALIGGVA